MTTQLDCSIGAALESTYGTIVTPTKFVEFTDESFDWDPTFVQGVGLHVGSRVVRSARRGLGRQQVTGDMTVEAASKGLGWLLNAAFGGVVTTQRATTGVYQQVHVPTQTDYLNSYTFQKGIPPLGGGAAVPHTFPGMVCSQIEFQAANSDILKIVTSWNGRNVDTATAYAAPSYPAPFELFEFVEGSIAIGGTVTPPTTTALGTGGTAVADIRDINLTWNNALDDGGFNLGSGGKRARKPATGLSAITGTMTAEFDNVTLRDAYVNQNDLALLLTFTGSTTIGSGSDHPALQIYVPNIRLEGELPKSNQGAPITQSVGFTGFDNLTPGLSPISVVYVSTDTAP